MTLSVLIALAVASFASHAYGQFDTDLTTDPNGTPIYVAAGSTSLVAAPTYTPTLVYNCYYMPLICENVADYAKDINPAGSGDLGAMQLFYYDPDNSHKNSRRSASCGCFQHDNCPSTVSNGKYPGTLVTQIGNQFGMNGLNPPIDLASSQTILAGPNPGVLPNTNNAAPRAALSTIPGRFFGQGVAFSCDEFPAAVFINGGSTAKTICALQSWKIYQGSYDANNPSNNAGKWPLPANSGQSREQDWQALSHLYLKGAYGSRSSGTVYPFSFTTTTAPASAKAWVVKAGPTTKAVNKRDGSPTFTTYTATTTVNVFGDEELEPEDRLFKKDPLKIPPNPRFRRQFAAAQTSTVSPSSDAATTLVTSRLIYGAGASSAASPWANSSATTSSTPSTLLSASAPSSDYGTGASSTALGSENPSTTASKTSSNPLRSSIFSSSLSSSLSTTVPSSVINSSAIVSTALGSESPLTTASNASSNSVKSSIFSSSLNPSLFTTAPSSAINSSVINSPLVGISTTALNASSGPLRSSISLSIYTASSAINSSAIAGDSPSVGISSTASATRTSPTPGPTTVATSSGIISTSDSNSNSSSVTASALQSSGVTIAGNPVATSSASAVSANVASASSAAAALVANPSSQNAQAAQQQINNATEAASAMLALAVAGSPLADALLSLIATLGTAASAANAAVAATTPAEVSAAASELVSDLEDASNNAEDVKEKAEDDDGDDSPSAKPSASDTSPSTTPQASSTTISSTSTPSSITSSASSASSSFASSSTTSSSASAGPSVCTLAFDQDGAEDIEVGDDYTDGDVDLDSDTADDVPCMPIYGAGSVIIPCDASVPSSAAFSSAASTAGAGTILSTIVTAISFGPYPGPAGPPTEAIPSASIITAMTHTLAPYPGPAPDPTEETPSASIIVISTDVPFTPAPSPGPSHDPSEHEPPPSPFVGAGRVD